VLTRADKLLIGIMTLCVIALYPIFWGARGAGEWAVIKTSSAPDQTISLQQPQRVVIKGPIGDTVIEVADGKVRFVDSPCDNKQCIHSGWLKQLGDFAACIPNRISIVVSGPGDDFDAINF
jgi:hypothetical protein